MQRDRCTQTVLPELHRDQKPAGTMCRRQDRGVLLWGGHTHGGGTQEGPGVPRGPCSRLLQQDDTAVVSWMEGADPGSERGLCAKILRQFNRYVDGDFIQAGRATSTTAPC